MSVAERLSESNNGLSGRVHSACSHNGRPIAYKYNVGVEPWTGDLHKQVTQKFTSSSTDHQRSKIAEQLYPGEARVLAYTDVVVLL